VSVCGLELFYSRRPLFSSEQSNFAFLHLEQAAFKKNARLIVQGVLANKRLFRDKLALSVIPIQVLIVTVKDINVELDS
jgi:hypothetical protein